MCFKAISWNVDEGAYPIFDLALRGQIISILRLQSLALRCHEAHWGKEVGPGFIPLDMIEAVLLGKVAQMTTLQ